ncbi:serine/threonine protein kinase [Pseudomonas umsongensis]|jgi:eukaryotic-like serine/threonine-protein kinase|uniref:serine/threonine-protein kinase n=1 Tax=Pseudomonas umsongensis TaxID=198618 RepID=UPI001245C7B6|nr:serine/threonine-protein kinase [Pseudomonas umsongensis]QFG32564.1 serine/threonine protein kinase [Pseudomonas umsongensis]
MNSVVPELQIIRKLGSGHFGEVFLGQDGVHGEVAVKVVARKPEDDDAQWLATKQGFLAEAQHLSNATHRNVVQVYGIQELVDSIRFTMAYCPGGSLQSYYERSPLTLAAVRKVATDVLIGLGALHGRGMLHRDIKPGNILLDHAGMAKLGDFGLVTDNLLLGYGSAAGYADHIALEVWQGRGTSVKSDIWALGMTLFRLLHGEAWYILQNEAPADIVTEGGLANRLRWLPHVPKPWRRVIRKMLADDPNARYASTHEVLNAISVLPIEPAWTVNTVTPVLVRWELRSPRRLNVVEWTLHSERRHEWKAWSQPVDVGRMKTLGQSHGVMNRRDVDRDLEAYFD